MNRPKYQSRNLKKSYNLGAYAPLYKSQFLTKLKRQGFPDKKKAPISLDFGSIQFYVARHFGFCKGVENAIEVAYETLEQNPDRRVYMISELIHNPFVNHDLKKRGLRFIKTAKGKQLIPWQSLKRDDIVITPAFGASKADTAALNKIGIETQKWNATCRFVENVWLRSQELGKQGYTIIVHGKYQHEETRATFSHSQGHAPTVVIRDMTEARILSNIILGKADPADFEDFFDQKASPGFDPIRDLQRIAVVNQTTMLASETAQISHHFRQTMIQQFGLEAGTERVANTRDTLCYATKNNQTATLELLNQNADLAIVIGGRNSSNTGHLVKLCQQKLPTYFIRSKADIISKSYIRHFDLSEQQEEQIESFLPLHKKPTILITSGASCPDALVEEVIIRLASFFPEGAIIKNELAGQACKL